MTGGGEGCRGGGHVRVEPNERSWYAEVRQGVGGTAWALLCIFSANPPVNVSESEIGHG